MLEKVNNEESKIAAYFVEEADQIRINSFVEVVWSNEYRFRTVQENIPVALLEWKDSNWKQWAELPKKY